MFSKIIEKFRYKFLLSQFRPEIIAYKNYNEKKIKGSRTSNLTHISNKQNINVGENVFIGHFNYIDGYDNIIIAEGCQITNYISILTHSSHHAIRLLGNFYNNASEQIIKKAIKRGPVKIGPYTYIGAHSVIMPGTNIGKGCIVSAFSYVDGDFPDFSIIKGIPAKVVGNTKDVDSDLLVKNNELKEYYYLNEDRKF